MIADCSDPQKYHTLQLETLKSPLTQQSMNADFKQTVTVEEDAVNVKGLALTKIHITFGMRDETPDHPVNPAAKEGLKVIEKMYGPDGMTMYTAVVGKRILTIIGSDATILESSVAAAQADTDILSNNGTITRIERTDREEPGGGRVLSRREIRRVGANDDESRLVARPRRARRCRMPPRSFSAPASPTTH